MAKAFIVFGLFLSFSAHSALLSRPAEIKENQRYPLLVVLHGCLQSPQDIASATQFGRYAEERGFFALFPEQSALHNNLRCWNWFRSQDQRRGGEPQRILREVQQLQKTHAIDSSRIYIAGFSAGAAMAVNLASCYPEVFAGVALHSGTTFKAASNAVEAFSAMKTGSKIPIEDSARLAWSCSRKTTQKPLSTLLIHGELDTVVTPRFVNQLMEQFTAFNDFLDDGSRNNSFELQLASSENGTSRGGYRFQNRVWKSGETRLATLTVSELKHAWSGGRQQQYSDPNGPSATEAILEFFGLGLVARKIF